MLRHPFRRLATAVLLAVTVLTPLRRSCAQDTPFVFVPLDLNARIARGILPYKQPFYLYGPTFEGTTRINVLFRPQPRAAAGAAACTDDPGDVSRWRPLDREPWLRPVTADTFYAAMPEFSPNRFYELCLLSTVQPVGDVLKAFQRTAATILDSHLRQIGADLARSPRLRTRGFYRDFQRNYIRALSEASHLTVKTRRDGGLFDTTGAELPRLHTANLNTILTEQDARASDLQLIQNALSSDAEQAAALFNNPLLARFGAAIARLEVPGLSGAEVQRATATALYLSDTEATVIPELLRGETRLDLHAPRSMPTRRLENVWEAADLDPRVENLDSSATSARLLRAAITGVRASKALMDSTGLTAQQTATLAAGVHDLVAVLEKFQRLTESARTHTLNRAQYIRDAATAASAEAHDNVTLAGSSVMSFMSRAKSLVTADVGLAAVGGVGVVPYFGANFYFEPVNKAIPLSMHGSPGDRLSVTVGITTQTVQKAGERDDLFGSFGLLAGIGVRFADPLRITVGGMGVRDVPSDPLSSRRPLRVAPFASLSIDWDVKQTLGQIADKLF